MSLLLKILIVLFVLLMLRFLIYLNKFIQIKRYYKSYLDYIKNPSCSFFEKKPQIIKLFKDAKIKNFVVSRLEPAGYGQVAKLNIDGFENMTLNDVEVVTIIKTKFRETIGVYRNKLHQTINPIFWIEFVFKLPEHIFEYLGFKSDNILAKILQIIYWIVAIIIGLEKLGVLTVFKFI